MYFTKYGYSVVPVLIISGKMHFLLISENNFFHEMKCDGRTSFHGIHDDQIKLMLVIVLVACRVISWMRRLV